MERKTRGRCARSAAVWMAAAASVAVGAAEVKASAIDVGSGGDSAQVYVEFKDGAIFTFDVAFDAPTTGIGLFDIIEAESTLTTVRQDFGFGVFIDGISFMGHSNVGFGGGDDWWHYWTKDAGEATWTSPPIGAADRVVLNGGMDGWVYGHGGPPVPEPAAAALMLIGGAMLARPGRRRRTITP